MLILVSLMLYLIGSSKDFCSNCYEECPYSSNLCNVHFSFYNIINFFLSFASYFKGSSPSGSMNQSVKMRSVCPFWVCIGWAAKFPFSGQRSRPITVIAKNDVTEVKQFCMFSVSTDFLQWTKSVVLKTIANPSSVMTNLHIMNPSFCIR